MNYLWFLKFEDLVGAESYIAGIPIPISVLCFSFSNRGNYLAVFKMDFCLEKIKLKQSKMGLEFEE